MIPHLIILSLDQAAHAIAVSPEKLSAMWSGKLPVSLPVLRGLSTLLGTPLDTIDAMFKDASRHPKQAQVIIRETKPVAHWRRVHGYQIHQAPEDTRRLQFQLRAQYSAQTAQFMRDLANQGMSQSDIARHLKVSRQRIKIICNKLGLERGVFKPNKRARLWDCFLSGRSLGWAVNEVGCNYYYAQKLYRHWKHETEQAARVDAARAKRGR